MASKTKKQDALVQKKSMSGLTWFKNVSRSLGYTSTELISDIAPSMKEFGETNIAYGRELVQDFRDLRSSGNRTKNLFDASTQMGHLKSAFKNAMEDIKTGNIYNKERQERAAMGDDDFGDFGGFGDDDGYSMTDFEFGDGDGGGSSEDGSKRSTDGEIIVPSVKVNVKNIQAPMGPSHPMVKIMERNTQAVYDSAQMSTGANAKIAQQSMIFQHAMHGRTLEGLQTINENLALLVNFQSESMSKYIGGSLKYYEDSLKVMNATLEHMQTTTPRPQEQDQQRREDPTADVLLFNGGLNAKGYMNMVKSNFKRQLSENPFLAPVKMMFDDDMTMKYLAASPLSFLSSKIVMSIVPKFLQDSLGSLDKSFSNFFPAMFMRLNKELASSNPIMQLLGEVFGLKVQNKQSVDLSKYNKGTVPFDGVTRKSIVEVIPGYLRKILSALTGQEEVAFDHDRGRFRKMNDIHKDFEHTKESTLLSVYNQSLDELKKMAETFPIESKKEREAFMKGINQFVIQLTNQDGLINPKKLDELNSVYDFNGNRDMQKVMQQMLLNMDRNSQTKLFGTDVIQARRRMSQLMDQMESDPLRNNTSTIFNDLGFDEHLDKSKGGSNSPAKIKKGFGILNPTDGFGMSSLDYIRDIKKILLGGIRVFAETIPSGGGPGGPGRRNRGPALPPVLQGHLNQLDDMKGSEDRKTLDDERPFQDTFDRYSDEQKAEMRSKGRFTVENFGELGDRSSEEISQMLKTRKDYNKVQSTINAENNRPRTIIDHLKDMLETKKGDESQSRNLKDVINDLMKKPAELVNGLVTRIDRVMYNMVFGPDGDGKESSLFQTTMAKVKSTFSSILNWTNDKVLIPINEKLFGKEGIVTKIQDSDMMKSFKTKMKSIGDFVFGKASGENGKREGGMLSQTSNEFMDMWDRTKYYFTGKAYTDRAGQKFEDNQKSSVFGEVQKIFKGFTSSMKTYLVGEKKEDGTKDKGVLTGAIDIFKTGFMNFKEAIFGPKSVKADANQTFKELTDKVKQRAPKALATGIVGGAGGLLLGGKMGLLGSLFLPGGPLGGAIIGTAIGFLGQSDKFKNWLFGEQDENGERMGGFLTKKTQTFFKENRAGIIGGAGLGAAKAMLGFGLLPSFFLPGGPIGGALMGAGLSVMVRSEAFQKMMFGAKDLDGKRAGGIIGRAFGQDSNFKKILGNVGVGMLGGGGIGLVASKLGLMGAMLVPGGPIGGAILGAAAGIALSSDKWKTALFGDWDEETNKRKGGLIGQFHNWFKLELMEPLKLQFKEISINVKEWFTEKIGNPFIEAIDPIKKEFSNMMKKMTDMFSNGWDMFKTKIGEVFEKNVGQPFGQFMKEKVMDPLKFFMSGLVKGIGKVFGGILQSPVKALSMIANGLTEKHKKQGLEAFQQSERDDMFGREARNLRKEQGIKLKMRGMYDAEGNRIGDGILSRSWKMHFNKETRENAKTSAAGADYLRTPAISDEEKKLQKEEIAQRRAALKVEKEKLKKYQSLGLKYDYNNHDANGMDISRIYDGLSNGRTAVKKSRRKLDMIDDTMFEQMTGVSMSKLFGRDMKISDMNKEDQRKMMDILNGKMSGARLEKFIKTKFGLVDPTVKGEGVIQLGPGAEDKKAEEAKKEESPKKIGDMLTDVIRDTSAKSEVQETNNILSRLYGWLTRSAHGGAPHLPTPGAVNKKDLAGYTSGMHLPGAVRRMPSVTGDNKGLKVAARIVRNHGKDGHSHASGIDDVPHDNYQANLHQGEMVIPADQANVIRQASGQPSQRESSVQGPMNDSNRIVNSFGDGSTKRMNRDQLLHRIAGDVRSIAKDVHGQLDGVGSNVFKMRKLIQQMMGGQEADMTGSGNRDRVGFWGNVRRAFFKPFETIRDKFMQGVDFVVGKVRALGDALVAGVKAVVKIPVEIAKGMWEFTKHVGTVVKETALNLVKVPVILSGVLVEGAKAMVEGVKIIGPALANALGSTVGMFANILGGVGKTIYGFGKGLGEFFVKFGEGSGKFITELATFGVKMTKNIGGMIVGATQSMVELTGSVLGSFVDLATGVLENTVELAVDGFRFLVDKIKDVGKLVVDIISSPLKFLGKAVGKLFGLEQREVIVKGGHLDSIGAIGTGPKPTEDKKQTKREARATRKSNEPMPVRIVTDNAPNPLNADTFKTVMKSLSPISVEIVKDHTKSATPIPIPTPEAAVPNPGQVIGDTISKTITAVNQSAQQKEDAEQAKRNYKDIRGRITGKNVGNIKEQMRINAEKKFTRDATEEQIALLRQIANKTTEHADGWMDIFGKKGLLTLMALAALPFLGKIWNAVKNFFDSDKDGGMDQDATSAMISAAKQGTKIVAQKAKPVFEAAKGVYQAGKVVVKSGQVIADIATNTKTAKVIAESPLGKFVAKAGETVKNFIPNTLKQHATNKAAKQAAKADMKALSKMEGNQSIASKIADEVKSTYDKTLLTIRTAVQKFMENEKVQKAMGSSAVKVLEAFMDDVKNLAKDKRFVTLFMEGMAKKGSANTVKAAASTAVPPIGLVIEGGFALWNSTTGFINTGDSAYLFNVYEDDVTPKMRIVTSLMKTLLGFSWLFIIELLNAVAVHLTDGKVNMLLVLANKMYEFMTDEMVYDDLMKDQAKFEKDAEEAGFTKAAWNEKNNKTFERKVGEAIGKGWNATKKGAQKAGKWVSDGWSGAIQGVKDAGAWVGEKGAAAGKWISDGWSGAIQGAKDAGAWIGGKSQELWDGAKQFGSNVWTGAQNLGNAAWTGAQNLGNAAWNGAKNLGNAAWNGAKATGQAIGNGVQAAGQWVGNTANNVWNGAKDMGAAAGNFIGNGARAVGNFVGDTGKAIWNSGPVKTVRDIGAGVGNLAESVGYAVSRIGEALWEQAKSQGKNLAKLFDDAVMKPVGEFFGRVADGWNAGIKWIGESWNNWVTVPLNNFFGTVRNLWDIGRKLVSDTWNQWVTVPVQNFFNTIVNGWNSAVKWVGEAWTTWITTPVRNFFGTVRNLWHIGRQLISDSWSAWVTTPIRNFFRRLIDGWNAGIKWIGEAWNEWVTEPISNFFGTVQNLWHLGRQLVSDTWNEWVVEPVNEFFDFVGDSWTSARKWVGDTWHQWVEEPIDAFMGGVADVWNATGDWLTERWENWIVNPINDFFTMLREGWDTLTGWLGDAWGEVAGFFGETWDGTKRIASDAAGAVGNGWNYVTGGNTKSGNTLGGDIKTGLDSAANKVKDFGDWAYNAIAPQGGPEVDLTPGQIKLAQGGPEIDPKKASMRAGQIVGDSRTPSSLVSETFPGWKVTSLYGIRSDPFSGKAKAHTGIDLVKPDGSPVPAFVGGKVIFARKGYKGSGYNNMGNVVAVKDGNGFTHIYAHLKSMNVKEGDTVQPGQSVGAQGSTGRSTGSHLHYEVRSGGFGTEVDPTLYHLGKGKSLNHKGVNLTAIPGLSGSMNMTGVSADTGVSGGTTGASNPGAIDIFSKMVENFSIYASNVITGRNDKLSLTDMLDSSTDTSSASSTASSSGGSLSLPSSFKLTPISGVSDSTQRAIIEKAMSIVIQGEGGRVDAATKDHPPDSNSPRGMSLGYMQWNKGRAQAMVEAMANQTGSALFKSMANNGSMWTNDWWSDSTISQYKAEVNANKTAADAVQKNILANDIVSTNLAPIFKSGKLKDPRSIVMLSDIGNTGPAHIKTFLNAYSPSNSGDEFSHFYQELMTKSYWGNKGDYKSRLKNTYNSLQGWNVGQGGPEVAVDYDLLAKTMGTSVSDAIQSVNAEAGSFTATSDSTASKLPSLSNSAYTDSYRSMRADANHSVGGATKTEGIDAATMDQVIAALIQIAANTKASTIGLNKLAEKDPKINIVTAHADGNTTNAVVEKGANGTQNVMIVNGGNKFNTNPVLGALNDMQGSKEKADYSAAKQIARLGKF